MKNFLKLSFKSEVLNIILLLVSIVASFWFYTHMPETVPIHWGITGEADGFGSKTFAAFFFPALILGIYLLLLLAPYFDPNKERYAEFAKEYSYIRGILTFFFTYVYFMASLAGVGYQINIAKAVSIGLALMFMVLGNYLGKIKPNWFVGIRTPWTLSSEDVWNKTHRFGGKLFFISGLLLLLGLFFPAPWLFVMLMVLVFICAIGSIVYSYILFRAEKEAKGGK